MIINYISDFCFPGGIPVHQGEIALRLSRLFGHEIRLCVPWPLRYDMAQHKLFIEQADRDGRLPDIFEPLHMLVKIHSQTELKSILDSADINHFHGTFSTNRSFLGEAIRLSTKVEKNIYTFHSETFNPCCTSDQFELNFRIGQMSQICAVSQKVKTQIHKLFSERNVHITLNGSVGTFTENQVYRPFIVLFIGRLNKTKGIESVINFAKKIQSTDIILHIVGISEFDKRYDDEAYNLEKELHNVIWTNKPITRKEIFYLYDMADVLYFPSAMEGGGHL